MAKSARFYLLLNSDTLVRGDAIERMIDYAEYNQDVGLVSPRLEWPDGTSQVSCFHFLSPVSELISSARTGPVTNYLKRAIYPIPVSDEVSFPDWTSFASVLIRDQVLSDIGLLDDKFFMYYEDTEFCYRAMQHGWRTANVPSAHIVHLRGGSSPVKENVKSRKRLPKYFYESRTRYFYKVYGKRGLLWANILWTAGHLISLLRQLVAQNHPIRATGSGMISRTNWRSPDAPYTKPGN